MSKLNLLFLGRNGSDLVGDLALQTEFEFTMSKYANCKYAGEGFPDYIPGEKMDETVQRVMPEADWVFDADEQFHKKKPRRKSYKVGVFVSDLHANHHYGLKNPVDWANMIVKANYDGVFMRYPLVYGCGQRPEIVYDILGEVAHWVPWSINTERFYPRKEKKYDVTCLGALYDCYPLRKKIYEGLHFVARGHRVLRGTPPSGNAAGKDCNELKERYIVGGEYAEALGCSRILIFDCSIYRYPLMKFFEGMASGCLVMSDSPAMAKRLGFMDRITYSEIHDYDWEDGLRFFLERPKEIKKIADPGMRMTRKYHSHDARSKQFIQILKEAG